MICVGAENHPLSQALLATECRQQTAIKLIIKAECPENKIGRKLPHVNPKSFPMYCCERRRERDWRHCSLCKILKRNLVVCSSCLLKCAQKKKILWIFVNFKGCWIKMKVVISMTDLKKFDNMFNLLAY